MRSGRRSYVRGRSAATLAGLALGSFACGAAPPPRPTEADVRALEQRASEVCCRQRPACDLPPHSFTTDVCSAWPDGDWGHCCVVHDIAYWCGGSEQARREADQAFRACLSRHGDLLAGLSYFGVRVGGVAWAPFPWRWGYGWDWLEAPP